MLLSTSSLSILVLVLSVISIALFVFVFTLARKLKAFLAGTDGKTLESAIVADRAVVQKLIEENKILRTRLDTAEHKMTQAVRTVETVRFNPFPDQGSNQSFATALLDETGSGVILSSLYARERVSIFAKPVQGFTSTYELTVEEKEAIQKTKQNQYGK